MNSKWEFFPEVDERMNPEFMRRLVALRKELDFPFPVTSSFRDPGKNIAVGGVKTSAHLLGRSVDIVIHGEQAYNIVAKAKSYGFTGIGINQHGPFARRFIHLDDMENSGPRPRPRVWTYP